MSKSDKYTPYLNVPLSSNFFTVNTQDAVKGDSNGFIQPTTDSPYNIDIYNSNALFSGAIQRVQLTEINMPFVSYNVNEYNNVLYLQKDDQTMAYVEIQPGFYNGTALATAVQTALNTTATGTTGAAFGVSGWTCVYNTNQVLGDASKLTAPQGSFTISSNPDSPGVPVNFTINPMIGKNKGTSSLFGGSAIQRTSTLAFIMGYEIPLLGSTPIYKPVQTGTFACMLYTTYIDIVSTQLTKFQNRDSGTSNTSGQSLIARIYINPEGSINYFSGGESPIPYITGTEPFSINKYLQNSKFIKWDKREYLSSLNIKILDQWGNLLYVPPAQALPLNPTPNARGIKLRSYAAWVQLTFNMSEVDTDV